MDKTTIGTTIGAGLVGIALGVGLTFGTPGVAQENVSVTDKGDGIAEIRTTATIVEDVKLDSLVRQLADVDDEIVAIELYCTQRQQQLADSKASLEGVIAKSRQAGVEENVVPERDTIRLPDINL